MSANSIQKRDHGLHRLEQWACGIKYRVVFEIESGPFREDVCDEVCELDGLVGVVLEIEGAVLAVEGLEGEVGAGGLQALEVHFTTTAGTEGR